MSYLLPCCHNPLSLISAVVNICRHLGPNNAKLVILDGCGHMPHAEKHKDFNAIVTEFLDDSVPDDMYMYPDIKSKAR